MLTDIILPIDCDTTTKTNVLSNCSATVTKSYEPVISSPWNGTKIATDFHGGEGSELDPYQIFDGSELAFFLQEMEDGKSFEGKYVVLTSDIDMDSHSIAVASEQEFKGVFDGKGHSIKGLVLTGTGSHTGMFAQVSGTLRDVSFDGGSITATVNQNSNFYAGIVAELLEDGLVENIYSSINVRMTESYHNYVGGIVGYNNGGTIQYCISTGSVTSENAVIDSIGGGIAGYSKGGTISACYSSGSISVNGSIMNKCKAAQIVGEVEGEYTVEDCYCLSTAAVYSYNISGRTSNTLGTADTQENCVVALKELLSDSYWVFSGSSIPTLKIK